MGEVDRLVTHHYVAEDAMSGSKGLKRYNGVEQDDEGAYVYYDEHIAALRRAKAEGLREGARLARWHAVCAFEAHPAAALERAATDIESVAKQLLDARAAQIEEGE